VTAPTRVSFPRGVWIVLAVIGVLQVVGTGLLLLEIQDQRSITRAQLREARPVLDSTGPLAREQLKDLPKTRRLAVQLRRLAREATPLAAELRAAGVDDSARAAQALADELLRADVGSATRAGRELADSLLRSDAGGTFQGVGYVVGELLYRYRLRRLIVSSLRATKVIPRQYKAQLDTLRVQRQKIGRAHV
jgi:hypothetical protein